MNCQVEITSGSTDTYISVTIHHIDNMHSYCLTTTYFSDDHTVENTKQSPVDTLSEWNLDPSHLVAIMTDSGSNIQQVCLLLHWTRICCFGHNLDLAIQKSLQDDQV